MARIRYIKPDFFEDTDIAELSIEARLLYIGLWTLMDRGGFFPFEPRLIKKNIFGYDDKITAIRVSHLLAELVTRKFLYIIAHDGKEYLFCPSLKDHQKFHKDEKPKYVIPQQITDDALAAPCQHPISTLSECTNAGASSTGNGELVTGNGQRGIGNGQRATGNISAVVPAPSTQVVSFPKGKSNPSFELVEHWKAAFREHYEGSPHVAPKEWGCAKSLLKTVTLDQAKELVTAFFEMKEDWFRKKRHALSILLDNLNAVQVYIETGNQLNQTTMRQEQQVDHVKDQLRRIDEGKLKR
ncbi:MAG: hypothetical protein ACXWQO_07910 [Bdellovibrionota bacterium]